MRPRCDEMAAPEDGDESFPFLLRTLNSRAVNGMPKRKYATTRSIRATYEFPNWSVYQPHQRKIEVTRCVQITMRSAQQTLIDAEMGVQCVGDVSRLMIGMTLHGTKSPGVRVGVVD